MTPGRDTAILIFSGTKGYRHDSVEAGVQAVEQLAAEHNVRAIATEDPGVFESPAMQEVAAVVWMQASGTGLLNAEQRAAYELFTEHGGGFAGVHAASDAERDWPLFDQLVGARFESHPPVLQSVPITFERPDDPSAQGVPTPWQWTEEWYAFDRNPRPHVDVIATIDEGNYAPGNASMGSDHPIAWRGTVGAAKTWYTSLGHTIESFDDPVFRSHLWGGISSVLASNEP